MNRLDFIIIEGSVKEEIEKRRERRRENLAVGKMLCSEDLRKAALVVAEYETRENNYEYSIIVEDGNKYGHPSDYVVRIWERSYNRLIISVNIFKDSYPEFEYEVGKARDELVQDGVE